MRTENNLLIGDDGAGVEGTAEADGRTEVARGTHCPV